MRTFPKALLDKPSPMHPDPPYSLNDGPVKGHSVNMSLLDCAPKSVGGRVLRQEILRKFKTAISLIVVRGADVVTEEDGTPRLIFNEVEAGDAISEEYAEDDKRWILSDWTYIIRPELPLYTMPYVSFIPCLREALQRSYVTGRRLEQEWAQTKAATIKSRGSVMLGTSKVPIKLPKGYSKQTEQAATLLMDRLKQIKGNSSSGEREADTDAETGAGGSIGSEETTGRSSLALDRLIERHSKSGLDVRFPQILRLHVITSRANRPHRAKASETHEEYHVLTRPSQRVRYRSSDVNDDPTRMLPTPRLASFDATPVA
ncbi:hypothetical protein BN946_scf184996.g41 [Trametes cinnabarina]|uniref:Uncharacterized protein n=1 Tax=Pycnoporus cinnabarinus TaxID=5643 RepID=A0A060S2S2_PYCCI|nr:hypothetical protein BN946_scf184996.g41 [Trametes cinnabarina]